MTSLYYIHEAHYLFILLDWGLYAVLSNAKMDSIMGVESIMWVENLGKSHDRSWYLLVKFAPLTAMTFVVGILSALSYLRAT